MVESLIELLINFLHESGKTLGMGTLTLLWSALLGVLLALKQPRA